MNESFDSDSVEMRRWDQEFDELAGRAAPPDRVDEILRRHAQDPNPAAPARATRLWPAALVLLGVAVTVGVRLLPEADAPAVPATPQEVTKQDKPRQDPRREKGQSKQNQSNQDPEKPAKKDPRKDVRLTNPLQADPVLIRSDNPFSRLLSRKRMAALTDEQNALKRRIARLEVELAHLDKKGGLDPKTRKRMQSDINSLRVKLATARQRAKFLTSLARSGKTRNPLLVGDYAKALDALERAKTRLETATDPVEARKILDEMTRILGDARRALWAKGVQKADK